MMLVETSRSSSARMVVAVSLVLCLAASYPVMAATMTPEQVEAAVVTWVGNSAVDARPGVVVDRLVPYPTAGPVAAYVAHLAGGGYCLAGADDRLLPVVVYQPRATYDPDCPALAFLLEDCAQRLARFETAAATRDPVLARYAGELADRRDDWAALVAGRRPPSKDEPRYRDVPSVFQLPLTSTWSQGSPYNSQCPVLTPPDEHVVVGCGATAAAQIMRYWQWPPAATGSTFYVYPFSYTTDWISTPLNGSVTIPPEFAGRLEWVPDNGGQLRMNGYWDDTIVGRAIGISGWISYQDALFDLLGELQASGVEGTVNHGQASFDWAEIQDAHTAPPGPGDYEVAELCWHVAVASFMDFGLWASNSTHDDVVHAYTDHFFYDHDAENIEINDLQIIDDLLWLRPVQIRGSNAASEGHSWVIQGYNVIDGTYLTNYGWGAAPDWVARDELFPSLQYIIAWIAPRDVVRFVASGSIGGDGGPAAPYANLAVAAAQAPNGSTLIFRTGGDYTFPGTSVTIDRPMTLRGIDVSIGPQ